MHALMATTAELDPTAFVLRTTLLLTNLVTDRVEFRLE